MAKAKPVKWALGADEPEDLAEFKDNEQLEKEHGGGKRRVLPTKGIYTFVVRRLSVKPNKNDDDRISVMLVVKEPAKSKNASWNGYLVWDGLNVTDQGAPFIKRFLKAMGLTWADFMKRTKQDDQDPPHIVQIGGVKFESGKDVLVRAMIRHHEPDDYHDTDYVEIARYIPKEDDDEDRSGDDEVFDGDEDAVDMSDDDDTDAVGDDEDGEDPEQELRDSLADLKIGDLRKRAQRNAVEAGDEDFEMPSGKAAIIDAIVEQEIEYVEDEDEDEGEEVDLYQMDEDDLRQRAIDNGRKKKKVKEADRDTLIKWITKDEDLPPF